MKLGTVKLAVGLFFFPVVPLHPPDPIESVLDSPVESCKRERGVHS